MYRNTSNGESVTCAKTDVAGWSLGYRSTTFVTFSSFFDLLSSSPISHSFSVIFFFRLSLIILLYALHCSVIFVSFPLCTLLTSIPLIHRHLLRSLFFGGFSFYFIFSNHPFAVSWSFLLFPSPLSVVRLSRSSHFFISSYFSFILTFFTVYLEFSYSFPLNFS